MQRLEKAGASRELAAAIAEAQTEAFSEALNNALATKADLLRLESKVETLQNHCDAKFDKLSWMMGVVIALAATNFAKQFF